jgi:spermidine synthase
MPSGDYIAQSLAFLPDRIVVEGTGEQVMMAWEAPLMERMAELAASRRGDVLEIGFGMGLCAGALQRLAPRSHTIVEAHPQIAERARAWASGRAGVRVLEGRWQDRLADLTSYDGIAFDVFGGVGQREAFFAELSRLLRPGGLATLWLADDRDMPAALAGVLRSQGFTWRMVRVNAVPDPSCTYSRTNEFCIPAITRLGY